jgi:hypothetical protein
MVLYKLKYLHNTRNDHLACVVQDLNNQDKSRGKLLTHFILDLIFFFFSGSKIQWTISPSSLIWQNLRD